MDSYGYDRKPPQVRLRKVIQLEMDPANQSVAVFLRVDTYTPNLHLEEKYTNPIEIVEQLKALGIDASKKLNEFNKVKREQRKQDEKRSSNKTDK